MEKYIGIDYGLGKTNIDMSTGIRYGIISGNRLTGESLSDFESVYPEPECPNCGCTMELSDDTGREDLHCTDCEEYHESDRECDPSHWEYNGENYRAQLDSSNDIWLFSSPYYTRAMFCSPCAPGACTMSSPADNGAKCYCFNHDWFENGIAPYPVYRVSDGSIVNQGEK